MLRVPMTSANGPEIREAASVIAGRDGSEGLEILVLERAARSRFLPGYVAFPGGAADDRDADLAERWFGTPSERARACAVRELTEEVGLALTAEGLVVVDGDGSSAVAASPPRVQQLPQLAHWIAPESVPVRFDARYFAVRGGHVDPTPDGTETADAWWIAPGRLLEAWEVGERKLYWPTYFTVRSTAGCRTVDELLALWIQTREPDDDEIGRLPRSTFWQDRA
jgi:8-oxo-dGTP pyrophosphatase MutT (NUDIX family)